MSQLESKGRLALLLVTLASSCALALDFDELQKGDEPSGGSAGDGGSGAISAGGGAGEPGAAGAGGDAGISLDDAPRALAETLCAKLEACVGRAAVELLLPEEDCVVSVEPGLANTLVANVGLSQENGTLTYDGSALPACLEAYAALPCDEVTFAFPEACKEALVGLLPEGEPCAHAYECDAGLYCDLEACPGVCRRPLQEGDDCVETDVCAPGLTCFQGSCEPLGSEGDECGANLLPGCATGFVCLGADAAAMMPGTCYSALEIFDSAPGQSCSLSEPRLCELGASCPAALVGARCVAEAEPGGACQAAVPEMCPDGEFCQAGVCAPLPGPNETCRFTLNPLEPRCQAYLRCVNNICRPLGDNGDPCGTPQECHSGACQRGECVPPGCH